MFIFELSVIFFMCFNISIAFVGFQKVCKGTNSGQSFVGDSEYRYSHYRSLYENCTIIDGNLEIVFLEHQSFDLNFLSSIKEISGYLLLVGNYVEEFPLFSLRIIRGRTLFRQLFSIYIKFNFNTDEPVGLKRLAFYSLHEILTGSIYIQENKFLCHIDTINWTELLVSNSSNVNISKPESLRCEECDHNCVFQTRKHCWGSSANMCQKFTKLGCDSRCTSRCFGRSKEECCDQECSSGCNGPQNNQCWACKNFENSGQCVKFCPPQSPYYSTLASSNMLATPQFKYSFGYQCVDRCPEYMFVEGSACVSSCSDNRLPNKEGKCIACEGTCPKKCKVDIGTGFLNSNIIHQYKNCTILQGAIKILDSSFDGDDYLDIPKMSVDKLQMLESIEEVTDFVQIQVTSSRLKNLSFFKNLKIIHGQKLDRSQASLHISRTRLKSLDLNSLKEIKHGTIFITNNMQLCYVNKFNWSKIAPTNAAYVRYNKNESECSQENEVCSPECTEDGCWGGEKDQCLGCRNSRLDKSCIASCSSSLLLYTDEVGDVCYRCHPQCRNSCSGPNSNNCDTCLHSKDGYNCVEKCPLGKYSDNNDVCQLCHQNCDPKYGCHGPYSIINHQGCISCVLGQSDNGITIDKCLNAEASCSEGFYAGSIFVVDSDDTHKFRVQSCNKCHRSCRSCNGSGVDACTTCHSFIESSRCVDHCSSNYFHFELESTCNRCHNDCLSCFGPSHRDCIVCLHYKVYVDNEQTKFKCVPSCPSEMPHISLFKTSTTSELICTHYGSLDLKWILMIIVVVCIVSIVLLIFILIPCFRDVKKRRFMPQSSAELLQLNPSNQQPDMAKFNLIKKDDLIIQDVIGRGAFGAVYQGIWKTINADIQVAIKVLQENGGCSSEQLLEEARIMATVHHDCCMPILAVCCCTKFMLITELMSHGSLHKYLRKKKKVPTATLR